MALQSCVCTLSKFLPTGAIAAVDGFIAGDLVMSLVSIQLLEVHSPPISQKRPHNGVWPPLSSPNVLQYVVRSIIRSARVSPVLVPVGKPLLQQRYCLAISGPEDTFLDLRCLAFVLTRRQAGGEP